MRHLFAIESCIGDYMQNSSSINDDEYIVTEEDRTSMLNQMISINNLFELFDSTLHCTVNIIDRYLSKQNGKLLQSKRVCVIIRMKWH